MVWSLLPLSLSNKPFAIIDVGSNSVRLVIFKSLQRPLVAILNKSVMCALGEQDEADNLLPHHIAEAIKTLRHFASLCKELNIHQVYVLGTAAVRSAANKTFFLKLVKETCGLSLQVLSSEQEATYATQSVLSAFPKLTGIVADLGGGSLELTEVVEGQITTQASALLGGLHLKSFSSAAQLRMIKEFLELAKTSFTLPSPALYLVGGAARAIAKIDILTKNYPLKLVHGYQLEGKEALKLFTTIDSPFLEGIEKLPSSAKKRKKTLPLSALVFAQLTEQFKAKEITFHGLGLCEGFAFSLFSLSEREKDPLSLSCQALQEERFKNNPEVLFNWLSPLLLREDFRTPFYERLLLALCLLQDLGWAYPEEYQADYIAKKILHNPHLLATHQERILLTLILCGQSSQASKELKKFFELLSPANQHFVTRSCLGLDLYKALSQDLPTAWQHYSLDVKANAVILTQLTPLASGKPLAQHLKLFPEVFRKPLLLYKEK